MKFFGDGWRSLIEALCDLQVEEHTPWATDVRERLRGIRIPDRLDDPPFRGSLSCQTGQVEFAQWSETWGWADPDPLEVDPWSVPSYGTEDAPIYNYLHTVARFVIGQLEQELARQISTGRVQVAGRIGSVLADPTILAPDLWRQLIVDDWSKGIATVHGGERIFSLQVATTGEGQWLASENNGVASIETTATPSSHGRLRDPVIKLIREVIPIGQLSAMTVKQTIRAVTAEWGSRFPGTTIPKDDTFRRARNLILRRCAKDA